METGIKPSLFTQQIERVRKGKEIGFGREKTVREHPSDPTKVISIFEHDRASIDMKISFYLLKILHLMYPNVIPDIHMSTGSWYGTNPSVQVRERVYPSEPPKWNRILDEELDFGDHLDSLGVSIENKWALNWLKDYDGNIKYVDGVHFNWDWDPDRFAEEVKKTATDSRREKALRLLDRLEKLRKHRWNKEDGLKC